MSWDEPSWEGIAFDYAPLMELGRAYGESMETWEYWQNMASKAYQMGRKDAEEVAAWRSSSTATPSSADASGA